LPQVPQLRASVWRFAHAPPEHCICPVGQAFEHMLLAQTCVPVQVVVQLPQWLLSDETHTPPHNMPEVQTHVLFWQV
jgi:hypothetical protein